MGAANCMKKRKDQSRRHERPGARAWLGALACLLIGRASVRAQEKDTVWEFFSQEVVAASQEIESLHEAPVITSVITGEQIKKMGARTLNEVLLTIPGFSRIQDHNEYFSALRGVYGSSQQKILVLRDGHRLNSRSYSSANFGPSIGLHNIKRIEVMRGPGATLYGDVATAGVINIVTKDGREVNGSELNVGAGDYGQIKLDYLYGRDLGEGRDLTLFGSIYRTTGEKKGVPASRDGGAAPRDGFTTLDRFGELNAPHDVGIKYRSGETSLMVNHRLEQYTMPRSGAGGTGQLVDPAEFRKFEGVGLGASFDTWHSELKYAPTVFDDVKLTIRPYYDTMTTLGGEAQRRQGEAGTAPGYAKGFTVKWHEASYGAEVSAAKPYDLAWGQGTALGGVQAEQMDMQYSWNIHSPDATHADYYIGTPEILPPGHERSLALFSQVKHRFNPKWLANVGARYDYKWRIRNYYVEQISPRAALVYTPLERVSVRASYGRSFADAPYWYRYNQLGGGGYTGSADLKPEKLNSYQLSVEIERPQALSNRLNLFYNDYESVIYRDALGNYQNSGVVKFRGIEYEIGWEGTALMARANATYQRALNSSTGYSVSGGRLEDVPSIMGNALIDYAPLKATASGPSWSRGLWLHYAVRYVGRQYSPITTTAATSGTRDSDYSVPAAVLSNAGFSLENFWRALTVRFHVYNLFDQQYTQGGSVAIPYEQPGRWWLAQVSCKW